MILFAATAIAGALFIGLAVIDIILRNSADAIFESFVALLFVALLFGGFAL